MTTDIHILRHVGASWCVAVTVDGAEDVVTENTVVSEAVVEAARRTRNVNTRIILLRLLASLLGHAS